MPNHVTNRLIISGPAEDIAKFKQECFTHYPRTENRAIDGRIICRNTKTTDWSVGWYDEQENLFTERRRHGDDAVSIGLPKGWEYEYNEAYDHFDFDKIRPMPDDVRETAGKGLTLEDQHRTKGRNWYDWCSSDEGWGTKWNSYDNKTNVDDEGMMEIMFDTAWTHPVPVITTMVEKYPTLTFNHAYYDEGGFFWGEDEYSGGVKTKDGFVNGLRADERSGRELCIALKGYDPFEDEEDEDED